MAGFVPDQSNAADRACDSGALQRGGERIGFGLAEISWDRGTGSAGVLFSGIVFGHF